MMKISSPIQIVVDMAIPLKQGLKLYYIYKGQGKKKPLIWQFH